MAKVKVDITRLLSEYEEQRKSRRALMSSTAIVGTNGVEDMTKNDSRCVSFLKEIRDSELKQELLLERIANAFDHIGQQNIAILDRMHDNHERLIAKLNELVINVPPATGASKPDKRDMKLDKIIAGIDDKKNYNTAEIRKILKLAPTLVNDDLKNKVLPGNWQSVGNIDFMNGPDFREALKSASFFR